MPVADSSLINKDTFDAQVTKIKEYCASRGEDIAPWLHDLHEKADPYFQTGSLSASAISIDTRQEILKSLGIVYERIERGETITLGYEEDRPRSYSTAFSIDDIVPVCRLAATLRRDPLSSKPFIPDTVRYAALENGTMTWDPFFALLGTMREWYIVHHHQQAKTASKWSRDMISELKHRYGDFHLEGVAEPNATLFRMILVCEMVRNGASLEEERFEPARLLDESIKLQPIQNVANDADGSQGPIELAVDPLENCFFPRARSIDPSSV